MTRIVAFVTFLVTWNLGASQDLIITNARIIDGSGATIEQGSIVVRDGRIMSVSENNDARGGVQIDAQGMTVMPGFIDAHRHVIRGEPEQWMREQASDRMREFLEAGFTTVLSAGDPREEILELRRQVEAGEILGPRLIVSGRVFLARDSGGFAPGVDPARFDRSRPPNRPTETAIAIPHDQTRATVQELVEAGVDAIKTILLVTPDGPEQETL